MKASDRREIATRFGPRARQRLENTTLAAVIRRNTLISKEISDDVFHLTDAPADAPAGPLAPQGGRR